MNDEKDLLSLFDQVVKEGSQEIKFSKEEIAEQNRLKNLHNLSQDNIDEVFELISKNNIENNVLNFKSGILLTQEQKKLFEKKTLGKKIILDTEPIVRGTKIYYKVQCLNCKIITFPEKYSIVSEKNYKCSGCERQKYKINVGDIIGCRRIIKIYNEKDHNSIMRRMVEFECIVCHNLSKTIVFTFMRMNKCGPCTQIKRVIDTGNSYIDTIQGKWKIIGFKIIKTPTRKSFHNRNIYTVRCITCNYEIKSAISQISKNKCYYCDRKLIDRSNDTRKLYCFENSKKEIGKKYNSLTILSYAGHDKNRIIYSCKCDCGIIYPANIRDVINGKCKECIYCSQPDTKKRKS